jgi:hypothetical protein
MHHIIYFTMVNVPPSTKKPNLVLLLLFAPALLSIFHPVAREVF